MQASSAELYISNYSQKLTMSFLQGKRLHYGAENQCMDCLNIEPNTFCGLVEIEKTANNISKHGWLAWSKFIIILSTLIQQSQTYSNRRVAEQTAQPPSNNGTRSSVKVKSLCKQFS